MNNKQFNNKKVNPISEKQDKLHTHKVEKFGLNEKTVYMTDEEYYKQFPNKKPKQAANPKNNKTENKKENVIKEAKKIAPEVDEMDADHTHAVQAMGEKITYLSDEEYERRQKLAKEEERITSLNSVKDDEKEDNIDNNLNIINNKEDSIDNNLNINNEIKKNSEEKISENKENQKKIIDDDQPEIIINSKIDGNIIEDYLDKKFDNKDDELVDVDLEDDKKISNVDLVDNMINIVINPNINVKPNDIIPDANLAQDKKEEKKATTKEVDILTNSCRMQTQKITGLIGFSDLPTDYLDYLNNLGIHDSYNLLKTTHALKDPTVKRAKEYLIGPKKMDEKELMQSALLFDKAKADHATHAHLKDTTSYQEEAKAIAELEMTLQNKGIDTRLIDNLINPVNNANYEEVKKGILKQMDAKANKRIADAKESYKENKKMMMNILGMDDKASLNPTGEIRLSENEAEEIEDELADPTNEEIVRNGNEYLQTNDLDKAITHLANQEDFISKLNPRDSQFYEFKKSVDTQKEWLLQKGLPLESLNKMLNCKTIENIAKQQEALKNAKGNAAKNIKESIDKQSEYLYSRGIKRDDLPKLIENKGQDVYKAEMAELQNIMTAKMLTKQPLFDNLDNIFYDRIATAFDAKHHEKGADLSIDNLKETAHIIKEMNLYSRQLAIAGKIAESSNINEHIVKLGKFLVAKGLNKEDLKNLKDLSTSDIDKKCEEIMDKVEERKLNPEKNKDEVKEDINKDIKKIEVQTEVKGPKNFLEYEQFEDVPKVVDPKDLNKDNIINDNSKISIIENEPQKSEIKTEELSNINK